MKQANKKSRKKAQSLIEYTLLVTISLVAMIAAAGNFLDGAQSSFGRHFNAARGRIVGGQR